jgi:hypothetical protein
MDFETIYDVGIHLPLLTYGIVFVIVDEWSVTHTKGSWSFLVVIQW